METQNAIEIHGVCKDYTNFQLKDISFQVPSGSIMGIIGENGAGKTTTIKLILNSITKSAGSIKVFGLDHVNDEKQIKRDIGVVLDESYFHESLKPMEIAKILSKLYTNWDDPLFSHYLKTFRIPNNTVKQLSRGTKMKLSLATALSHHPKLLILDEATGGLDPVVRNEILDIFLDFIQDETHSILISSHITGDLEKIADYITFIHEGTLVLSEPTDVLLSTYGLLLCGSSQYASIEKKDILGYRKNAFGYEVLVKNKQAMKLKYPDCTMDAPNLETLMTLYKKEGK
ncbi:MAG: ABC transporter ATP-binding protein [Anaerovorax sp.]